MKRLLLLAILFVLGAGIYFALTPEDSGPAQMFVVAKGSSAYTVARELRELGLIGSRRLFLLWVKLKGESGSVRPGTYQLSPNWSGYGIARQLRKGPPLVKVTFPEGWMARQMAELLEARGITPATAFMEIVIKEKREGYLFPDTYFFNQGTDPRLVIARMIDRFKEQAPPDMQERSKALKLSYTQIITLASLVEREAKAPSERPIIAGVFLNRLRKRWRLESCATVEYALGKWKPRLSYKDLAVASPYNTYTNFGLPPGPICNPGKASLDAAAHPAVTDAMFFVADGQGTHRFTRYYSEHLEGKRLRKKR